MILEMLTFDFVETDSRSNASITNSHELLLAFLRTMELVLETLPQLPPAVAFDVKMTFHPDKLPYATWRPPYCAKTTSNTPAIALDEVDRIDIGTLKSSTYGNCRVSLQTRRQICWTTFSNHVAIPPRFQQTKESWLAKVKAVVMESTNPTLKHVKKRLPALRHDIAQWCFLQLVDEHVLERQGRSHRYRMRPAMHASPPGASPREGSSPHNESDVETLTLAGALLTGQPECSIVHSFRGIVRLDTKMAFGTPEEGLRASAECPVYAHPAFWAGLPDTTFPSYGTPASVAADLIKDDLSLDCNPKMNLASFVTTFMEAEAEAILFEGMRKNFIDLDQYPQSADIHKRCVAMLADLYHAPGDPVGTSCVGSSEAIMLAGLAMKRKWQHRRKAKGLPTSKPNMVMGANVQVCWHKMCQYFDVEGREADVSPDCLVLTPARAKPLIDENTIGVCVVLGSTFNGEFEDVQGVHDLLIQLNLEHGWDVGIHVDAASGGFIAPFLNPDLMWDFRLPLVKSINVSGHKFGLVYAGIGWALWRETSDLPEDLVFHVNYLGGDQAAFTLNFSKGAGTILAQYYNFIRMGRQGYRLIMDAGMSTAEYLRCRLRETGHFDIVDKAHMPLVAFKLKKSDKYTCFDIQDKVRSRGWILPAYTCPRGAESLVIMRVVVKQNFTRPMADMLVQDITRAIHFLESPRVQRSKVVPTTKHDSKLALAIGHSTKHRKSGLRTHGDNGLQSEPCDVPPSLVRTYTTKPTISSKQLQQLLRWANSLKAWPEEITASKMPKQMQNGVLLCYLVHVLVPDFSLIKVNPKAKSFRAAQLNLEAILQCLSRFSTCTRNLLTPEAMWAGDRTALAVFLQELLHKVAVRRVPVQAIRLWAQGTLQKYGIACDEATSWNVLEDAAVGLWDAFRDGVRLWCLLHYYGYDNSPAREHLFQMSRVHGYPKERNEAQENGAIVCSVLQHFGIPVVWDLSTASTHKSHAFVLVQLHHLYECLHDKVTPLTSSPDHPVYVVHDEFNGVRVHGIHFADSSDVEYADRDDVEMRLQFAEQRPMGRSELVPRRHASASLVAPESTELYGPEDAPPGPANSAVESFPWDEYVRLKRAIAAEESSRMNDEEVWGVSKTIES
ncbi:glutamate decarboxylase, variant 2 [Aphanomyces invadans]|nr:glutamate decarboxylase, variant 2 [Aphanomyces invadans]ETW03449.1 glutamate decarboxylase, variant 2 [Aphanomyces invadans]|eukprot:XP_008867678.1 glutamate decarboxylase, variant 2 [Aphanomyces invadans]